ncbi:MAG: cytochrome c oxidase assembly protein [Planctomycetes bacterium]|nr:cytochrome c oxidase assembly protein [Planctomycetota bacterium]
MSVAGMPRWKLALLIAGLPVTMALLAFIAMPRLYSLWCTITGTGMNPNNAAVAAAPDAPTGRFVEAFFEARIYDGLPLRFWCEQPSVQVEVGREAHNVYYLENTGDRVLHIRPIHQVSPISATPHFGMRLCFCFNDQVLQPGERKEFPVAFTFSPQLDPRTATVSVCYSLFAIDPGAPRSDEQLRIQRQVEGAGGVVSPGFKVMSEAEIEAMRRSERQERTP